jgi:lysophospholipase
MAASPNFPPLPPNWTQESHLLAKNSLHLRLYRNRDVQKGRLLFLVHGQGEQSDRYEHFPFYLDGNVDAIACIDLPGHGKSQGTRGHIENFDQYCEAALTGFYFSTEWMKKNAGRCESHWFGHSLGGLISLRTLFKEKSLGLSSASVSSPLLALALPVPPLKKFFGELVEPILGSLKLGNELDGSLISHDSEVSKEYSLNPLNHGFVTPRFFVNLTKEMPFVQKNTGPFAYNLLLISALADKIVSARAGIEFFENLKMNSGLTKELVTFPEFYHESFNEIGKGRAFNALSSWLQRNSKY